MFRRIYSILTPFLFGGIVTFIINLFSSENLSILSNTFILIGMTSYILQRLSSRNLQKLKIDGICYEPLSIEIFNSPFLHAGGFYTFYIVCEFCDSDLNIQKIKSSLFIIHKRNNFITVDKDRHKLVFIKHPKVIIYSNNNKAMVDIINS